MTATIYLLRHANTTPSRSYAPLFDWPLDALGQSQARRLVPLLMELRIDHVACSPQRRATETVMPFASMLGMGLESREELAESGFNRSWTDDFSALVQSHWDDFDYCRADCESHRNCQTRFVAALVELARARGGNTLVCSGGQAIGLALQSIDDGFGFEDWAEIRTPDLFRLAWDGERLAWDREFAFDEDGSLS